MHKSVHHTEKRTNYDPVIFEKGQLKMPTLLV